MRILWQHLLLTLLLLRVFIPGPDYEGAPK